MPQTVISLHANPEVIADGAVVELYVDAAGNLRADLRIPPPKDAKGGRRVPRR